MGSRGSARPPIPSGGEIPNGGERTLTTRGGGNLDFPKEVKTHTTRGVGGLSQPEVAEPPERAFSRLPKAGCENVVYKSDYATQN